jgi:hypothetical protein
VPSVEFLSTGPLADPQMQPLTHERALENADHACVVLTLQLLGNSESLQTFQTSHPFAQCWRPWLDVARIDPTHTEELLLRPCHDAMTGKVHIGSSGIECHCLGNPVNFFAHFAHHLRLSNGDHLSQELYQELYHNSEPAWTPSTFNSVIRNAVSVVLPCSWSGQANLTFFFSGVAHSER